MIDSAEGQARVEKVVICADGASQGNPGPAAIGATITDMPGRQLASISQPISQTTNNQAEYRAVIAALEEATRLGVREVDLRLDSELIVRQIKGEYRVKKVELKPLYQRVKQLQSQLEIFTVAHIPRQQNEEAHHLARIALTGRPS